MKTDIYHSISLRLWPVLLISCIVLSCSSGMLDSKKKEEVKKPVPVVITKPSSSYADTLLVNTVSAVFFKADSVQMEKFAKIVSPMAFESIRHDCFYQMGYTKKVLEKSWPKVKIADAYNKRYILFKKQDGSSVSIDLDKLDVCGVMLFNGKKDPQTVDMTNIETELRYYFEF